MAELISGLDANAVRANLERVGEEIAAAADGREVEIVAATKYIALEELPLLASARGSGAPRRTHSVRSAI